MGTLVEVYWSFDLGEAICAKSYLDAYDIFSFIRNEHHITMSGGTLGLALGGYRILTILEKAPEARRLLAAAEDGESSLDDGFEENQLSLSLW